MEGMIKFININKSFDKNVIYDDFNIDIPEGKVTCILGQSGCGKTTLLKIISEDERFKGKISYVTQENSLIPWCNVYKNMEYVIEDIYDKNIREDIVKKYMKMLNIYEYRRYFPYEISGGTIQRVNIGRALVYPCNIMLMDEPFTSLDIKTKDDILSDFLRIQSIEKKTIIMVTHNVEECLRISDYIYVVGGKPVKIIDYFENNKSNNEGVKRKIVEKLLTSY